MEKHEITFRPLEPSDAHSIAEHANNIKVANNVRDHFPHPDSVTDAEAFIAHTRTLDPLCDFAIVVDGKAVGTVGYMPHTDVQRVSAEIGYWIGEKYWGKGIVAKIVADFTDFVFRERGLNHLYGNVFSTNLPSMRVLEKAGFRFVGIMHGAAIKNGRIIDLHYYEKVKE